MPPRILVTGFSVFPGAPVNPTEALIARLAAAPPPGVAPARFRAAVLPVEYAGVGDALAALCADFSPDIAIHFGLAREARGFRLERIAHNSHARARPDQAGLMPAGERICAGPDTIAATLPLTSIAARLADAGLPVEWSQDAGGYLCNMVMMLSLAHAVPGLAPAMSGFAHVPPLPQGEGGDSPHAMGMAELEAGARLVIGACARSFSR